MDTASLSISPPELRGRLGRADAPLLLDVRRPPTFQASEHLLPGAQYWAPDDVARLAAQFPPREAVVYCVYGHEVSQQAAEVLRTAGWNAPGRDAQLEGPHGAGCMSRTADPKGNPAARSAGVV